ncbi:MAG: DNA-binding response regulator [gamma proteobacterium symbiont of Ctena orbiculata]|uniref:Response regulator transcription factor n=1 Tax=Candidatus Thiodiazotropha taylori TaxID=2792791 RepID=A0A944MG04_9GAMM|nr:response regulator transcription factor [Candidatus Thiodiazotropha taylori]PUB85595.1 MAG: DNA-binding response regulator [gamma proteobacterium symbiont of Ctena orbiculata]MBT2991163.1 response regulator transcription factor [Candidatus Thiodiazotropha taylori]MBT2998923.1 response regulator transcription factor [Candidatus Thiodiazotropha taylori]MBT3002847.1 response regulator transcription factor [Candidatus Thiodiazotropha taylori]
MPRILLIDDDQALAAPLKEYFTRYDLELEAVTLPSEGLKHIEHSSPDLVILDIMLPEMDGFEVCRTIRKQSSLPILMLTARGEVMDRVVGLELGADDYLAKPFEPRELVARIQNILKRSRVQPQQEEEIILGDLKLDLVRQDAFIMERSLNLTTLEYRLLALLAQHPGRAYSRDEILTAVKGIEADLYTRSVDILVSRLRQKLKPLDYIKTVWGTGYRLVGPAA